jgi:peptidoglycan/xylan/chitin deacetylase (PgdA/CDA1 family)
MTPIVKRVLKRPVQALLARWGRQSRASRRPSLLILMYHRVLPPDHPEMPILQPGMVVHTQTLRMHLRLLKERFEVVHLDDWLQRHARGQSLPGKACAITFDDGWRDNFEHAFPLLREAALPATIFLVSDKVGTPESFWPERLARILWQAGNRQAPAVWESAEFAWLKQLGVACPFGQRPPVRAEIDAIIHACKRYTDADLQARLRLMESRSGASTGTVAPDILDWNQVQDMAASGLIRFGSHTRHHVRLSDSVDASILLDEIRTSREVIESHTQRVADVFCYPNGDYTPGVKRLVQDHYQAACTTQRGWNDATADRYQLKRIGIHNDVAADEVAFLAKLSGWM